jgi:hypothetical protein
MIRHTFILAFLSTLAATTVACNGNHAATPEGADASTAGRTVTRIAAGLDSPSSLAVDSEYAYMTTYYPVTSVLKVPLDGGAPITLASSPEPASLAIDSTTVYWTDDGVDGGAVLSIPKGGGTITTLAGGVSTPGAITVQGATVYWGTSGQGTAACDAGCGPAVDGVGTKGGAVTTIYAGPTTSFPDGLVVHGASVYISTSDGRIVEVPEDGGASRLLSFQSTADQSITADDTNVYWTNTAGDVMKMPLDGGTATPLALSQQTSSIAVDATGVYWANGTDGTIMTAPLDGGALVTIVTGQMYPEAIAIGPTSVYWLDGQGDLWVATPK